jgi:hypothetical protein
MAGKALCSSRAVELQGDAHSDFDWGGRMVSATFTWSGHALRLVSAYNPTALRQGPRSFAARVAAAWQRRP